VILSTSLSKMPESNKCPFLATSDVSRGCKLTSGLARILAITSGAVVLGTSSGAQT